MLAQNSVFRILYALDASRPAHPRPAPPRRAALAGGQLVIISAGSPAVPLGRARARHQAPCGGRRLVSPWNSAVLLLVHRNVHACSSCGACSFPRFFSPHTDTAATHPASHPLQGRDESSSTVFVSARQLLLQNGCCLQSVFYRRELRHSFLQARRCCLPPR